jgi:hypothetical protein
VIRTASYVLAAVAVALFASWMLWSDLLTNPRLGRAVPAPTARQRQFGMALTPAIERRLERRLPANVPTDDGLEKTLRRVAEPAGFDVFVNRRALEAAGVSPDTPVTVRVGGMTVADAVAAILAAHRPPLACAFDDGVLTVSTRNDIRSNVMTRVYDVRDLAPAAAAQKELVAAIQADVEPQSWRDAGGSVGSLRVLAGQLIVTQTPITQYDLQTYLNGRRIRAARVEFAKRAGPLAGGAAAIVLLVQFARHVAAQRRRRRAGLCRQCGYDLRASPDRCPECGTVVA